MALISRLCLPVLCILASEGNAQRPSYEDWKEQQANASAAEAAAAKDQSKMAAVDKVLSLLESLKFKVMAEGEAEARTYNEFACFCRDTTAEKTDAIQRGTDEQSSLSSDIDSYTQERNTLDTTIQTLTQEIATEEDAVNTSRVARASELLIYQTSEANLSSAITAITDAISALKASVNPSMAQMQSVSKTVRMATTMADALGLGGEPVSKMAAAFLQQDPSAPQVEMEDYKFHSGSIIETLEDLLGQFREEKAQVDAAEVQAAHTHDLLMQEKADLIKAKTKQLEDSKAAKAAKQQAIATASQQLTTVSAVLLDDQQYMNELSQLCHQKANAWDTRSQVRQDEISALAAAISIIGGTVANKTSAATIRFAQQGLSVRIAEEMSRSPAAMQSLEADAEEFEAGDAPSFLQVPSKAFLAPVSARKLDDAGRQALVALFRSKGQELKSAALTALAGKVAEDPFAKVKTLIQELIDRLTQEASNEATQKGWCDTSIAAAELKRDNAATQVETLNGQMATYEAERDQLIEELNTLAAEIAELDASMTKATNIRNQESAQNSATVAEAQEGMSAVQQAITILQTFYNGTAAAAAGSSAASLVQRGPLDDAPDAGFDANDTYVGAQGEAGGVIGMMQVIKSDFKRTITETISAESEAVQEYNQFMTDSTASKTQKETAQTAKTTQKDTAEANLDTASTDLDSQVTLLTTGIQELLELKPACIDTGMTYEERVARREEELAALKKGLCILENFAQFGPNRGLDRC